MHESGQQGDRIVYHARGTWVKSWRAVRGEGRAAPEYQSKNFLISNMLYQWAAFLREIREIVSSGDVFIR
jgi:hypothetical protein